MLQLIEALDFRCLRNVRQEVGPFQVLVGPNASGKTTFLDVVAFLGDLIRDGGPEKVIQARTENFRDLVWKKPASPVQAVAFLPYVSGLAGAR